MTRVTLFPLEAAAANVLAERREMTVEQLICDLLRREAAIELVQGPPMKAAAPVRTDAQAARTESGA